MSAVVSVGVMVMVGVVGVTLVVEVVVAMRVLAVVEVTVTVVATVAVEAVATVVVEAMACAGAVVDTLVGVVAIGVRADVPINAVDAVVITALECALSVPYFVDTVLSDVAIDSLMDALAAVLTVIIIGVPTGFGDHVLADVNVNAFTGAIAVGFAMPSPLEGFSC